MVLENKHVLVTGGTGSLGRTVVRRMLTGEIGMPSRITVFSRDEAKQHQMRVDYRNLAHSTGEEVYRHGQETIEFRIGNVRDYESLASAMRGVEIVVNAAALKQVPSCELFPDEAVKTNINGAQNLVRAVREHGSRVEQVVGISTDKACKPINVMGMTKAVMERIFVNGNLECEGARFNCVRYGNVIASRGSVVPLFLEQIEHGGPVTITTRDMTRFLLSLDQAVDTVFAALRHGRRGETFVPLVESARITDVAETLIGDRDIDMVVTGIRPGEKVHEIMVSEEERYRTIKRGDYFVIQPMLMRLDPILVERPMASEYSSEQVTLDQEGIRRLLTPIFGGRAAVTRIAA